MLVSTKRCEPLLLSSSQVKCTLTLRRSDPFCSAADRTKGKEANGVENKRRDWRECRESKARCMYFAYSVHASWQQRKLRTCSDKSVYGDEYERRSAKVYSSSSAIRRKFITLILFVFERLEKIILREIMITEARLQLLTSLNFSPFFIFWGLSSGCTTVPVHFSPILLLCAL